MRDSEEPEGDVAVYYQEVITDSILGEVEGAVYKVTIKDSIVASKCKVVVDDTDPTNSDETKIIDIGQVSERVGRPPKSGKVKVYLYDAEGKQVGGIYELTPIKVANLQK